MKNIVLTGFMGTGKTTVGQILAEKLKRKFLDTDQIIEEKLGTSIKEFFKKAGETKFREIEAKTIALGLTLSKLNSKISGSSITPIL